MGLNHQLPSGVNPAKSTAWAALGVMVVRITARVDFQFAQVVYKIFLGGGGGYAGRLRCSTPVRASAVMKCVQGVQNHARHLVEKIYRHRRRSASHAILPVGSLFMGVGYLLCDLGKRAESSMDCQHIFSGGRNHANKRLVLDKWHPGKANRL